MTIIRNPQGRGYCVDGVPVRTAGRFTILCNGQDVTSTCCGCSEEEGWCDIYETEGVLGSGHPRLKIVNGAPVVTLLIGKVVINEKVPA